MTKIDPAYAYNYYRQKGYSDAAAAGIVGNIHAESGFNTGASGDQGSAYGLTQLRGDRRAGLTDYAKQQGLDPSSPDAQLGYVDYEMRNGSDAGASRAYQQLQQAQTPADAASAFMHNYERPNANPAINNIVGRQQFANNIAGTDPNAGIAPVNLTTGAAGSQGIASLTQGAASAIPTMSPAVGSTPDVSADPMSGIFSLLAAPQQQQASMMVAPQPMKRMADNRTSDQKMVASSETPNVYLERLRQENG